MTKKPGILIKSFFGGAVILYFSGWLYQALGLNFLQPASFHFLSLVSAIALITAIICVLIDNLIRSASAQTTVESRDEAQPSTPDRTRGTFKVGIALVLLSAMVLVAYLFLQLRFNLVSSAPFVSNALGLLFAFCLLVGFSYIATAALNAAKKNK
jgi:hypothetical protein